MRAYTNNCYYCNFYIEDTCECELGYFDDSECGEWEEEDEEDKDEWKNFSNVRFILCK